MDEAMSRQKTVKAKDRYEQTHHLSDTAPYKIKNDIWDGKILGETQDPKFWKDLKPV